MSVDSQSGHYRAFYNDTDQAFTLNAMRESGGMVGTSWKFHMPDPMFNGMFRSMAFSEDEKILLITRLDGSIVRWNIAQARF